MPQRAEIVFFMRPEEEEEEEATLSFLSRFKTEAVSREIVDEAGVFYRRGSSTTRMEKRGVPKTHVVVTTGLEMPPDFPTGLYNSIHSRLEAARAKGRSFWKDYARSWNAVAHRYRACADLAEEFSESVQRHGDGPPQPERYVQDRALFGFFVNALSTIEVLSYALYSIGRRVCPSVFHLSTEADRRRVTPERTNAAFAKAFPGDPLTSALSATLSSGEWRTLDKVRNVLAHRGQPGRAFYLSAGARTERSARWIRGLTIHPSMVKRKRSWLARRLRVVLTAADAFVSTRL